MALAKGEKTKSNSGGSGGSSGGNGRSGGISLEGSSFSLTSKPRNRANVLIVGKTGTGKTTFVTKSCPDPVSIIWMDGRSANAIEEARNEGRTILDIDAGFESKRNETPADRMKRARQVADSILDNIDWSVSSGKIRTICIDGGSELTTLFDICYDGVTGSDRTPCFGRDKDYINSRWWDIYNIVKRSNAHLIVTVRAKAVWITVRNPKSGKDEQKDSGRSTWRCAEAVSEGSHWAGHIRLKKSPTGKQKPEIEMEIIKAGVNLSELGSVYDESDWEACGGPFTFITYNQFVKTTDITDWM